MDGVVEVGGMVGCVGGGGGVGRMGGGRLWC